MPPVNSNQVDSARDRSKHCLPIVDARPEVNEPVYWRSFDELEMTPEFQAFAEAEFPEKHDPQGVNRRRWMQLMGASTALAAAAGCRYEKEQILPFAERPPNRIPGKPQFFNTAMELGGAAVGITVTCYDGRPVKIEGNKNHPQSLGATTVFGQATTLEMYDPQRSRNPVERAKPKAIKKSWSDFEDWSKNKFSELKSSGGQGLAILSMPTSSPTLGRLKKEFTQQLPETKWFEYEPVTRDEETQGMVAAFGAPLRPHYDLSKARVIVCLDEDLLCSHPAALQYARQFAEGREVENTNKPKDAAALKKVRTERMNCLYAVESCFSVTGAAADERLPIKSSKIGAVAASLVAMVSGRTDPAKLDAKERKFVKAMAADLRANRGKSVVTCGPRQPAPVHAAVAQINQILGNIGHTVSYLEVPGQAEDETAGSIQELVAAIDRGEVQSLIILGGNPVYNAPADVNFGEALAKVDTSLHLSLYHDETSRACSWHVPAAHFLESWGDARSWDGTYSIVQPMIRPLWNGISTIELLQKILRNEKSTAQDQVKKTFAKLFPQLSWGRTLNDGVAKESAYGASNAQPNAADISGGVVNDGVELVFLPDPCLYDGRYANNGWLQELAEPLTKLTWDNVALVAPSTAKELGIQTGKLVTLSANGADLTLPAFILQGHAAKSITVWLGYGRTAAGLVGGDVEQGIAPVGENAYSLRTSETSGYCPEVNVAVSSKSYPLATTQDHHAIDATGQWGVQQRLNKLIREAPLSGYLADPKFAEHAVHHPPLKSLWEEWEYEGHRWGMSIDLNKCIGCNACVIACQAENNIPVVGKEQVMVGREMAWIRVDRYFTSGVVDPAAERKVDQVDVDNPRVALQPLTCHHCELAPCEQVCPVNATVHSDEGLNDMVYNRCIGTRYCGNNCPYKVRRFNYFNYRTEFEDPNNFVLKMLQNPEVTVRSRGVMEKCTYCVQRIQSAKIEAGNERRALEDGEVVTACQAACPTQAIVFGDLAMNEEGKESQVLQNHKDDRAYAMLSELNIKPRTAYMAKVRNPNLDLHPEAAEALNKVVPHGHAHNHEGEDGKLNGHEHDH